MEVIKLSQKAINEAAKAIRQGRVIVFPTDTVYGFIADASSKKAVDKIFRLKKRAKSKPLPVFVKDLKTVKSLAEITKDQTRYWPGKYTLVLQRKAGAKMFGQDKKTIALRIPKYKFLNSLLKKVNKPLVQTSVNISGKLPLIKIKDIINCFGKQDVLIIDAGNLPKIKPSTIIDLSKNKNKILRK